MTSKNPPQFWFRSTLFGREASEAKATNPFVSGQQVARWLHDRLVSEGRIVEEIVPEDWGWCSIVQRKPYLLWIGCGSVQDIAAEQTGASTPIDGETVWSCMVVAELSLLGRLKGYSAAESVEALFQQAMAIVERDTANVLVPEP
ncbi:hypothetical protein [Cupriavidus pauculus]|uniref:Uncharacterized protein n=1 Tax=Cupriavidus pauculus TaxID=82633 RepID=A0A2N5CDW7_9BURK|nr:hypothetical protein [Cupriavidus pauculus]PLQ00433.1 hypothetical protein CYJ10_12475 [Cupriavidus pauculus]